MITALTLLAISCSLAQEHQNDRTTLLLEPSEGRLAEAAQAFMRMPDFPEAFALSYLAESDIEPKVTEAERLALEAILKSIADGDSARAIDLIKEAQSGQLPTIERARRGRRDDGESEGPGGTSAVFDFTLGNVYFQSDDWSNAATAYAEAVRKFPRFRRAWKNLGLVAMRQGEFQRTLDATTRVIELGGSDSLTYGILGFAYSSQGNDVAAESAYRMALLLDPATKDWKLGLARSFFKQGRFADASSMCDALIREKPDAAELYLLQANALLGMGQTEQAARNYEIVDRLGKANADSLLMLADIYINAGNSALAVESYKRVLDMTKGTPASIDRAVRAGKVLVSRGDSAQAADLLAVLQNSWADGLSPQQRSEVLKMRSRIAMAAGDQESQAVLLEEIVAVDPLDGEALILLGRHWVQAGEVEKAVFCFERAAGIEKFEADAKVQHGQLLVSQKDFAGALGLLRSAQQLRPRESLQQYIDQVERISRGKK